jgi:hypothetical protein
MREKLKAAQSAAKAFRLRSYVGKMVNLRDQGNVYGEKIAPEKLNGVLDELVDVEMLRHGILEGAAEEPVSCKQLADRLGVKPAAVLRQIVVLRRKNLLELDHVDGVTPFYRKA